ncbi:DUF4292 domain-containing protein [Balneolales bacterium ANBcel1]|nr:DUF4292 domain-containing protein [Balneolales bacterium ANBcel1]
MKNRIVPFSAHRHPLISLFFLALVLASCAPPEILRLEPGTFERSEIEKEDFFNEYIASGDTLYAISGRASAQVSEPGHSERLTVRFRSNRDYSLLSLRNNLGIEGGRIYSDPDSVIIFNRLEDVAHKMSHDTAAWFYLNGIGAINLIRILHPVTGPDQIAGLFENPDYYLVETTEGGRHYIDREHRQLRRTELHSRRPEEYSTFHFENYTEIDGHRLPARIQILSYDEKSNIFFVIRSLEINPSDLDFDIAIPQDIEIIRL